MSWQAMIVDVVTLLVVGALAYMKVIPSEAAIAVISGVLAARAALAKPPSDGGGTPGGNAMSSSAAGAVGLGVLAVMGLLQAKRGA